MAGFEVTPYGRFCLTPEALKLLDNLLIGEFDHPIPGFTTLARP
jgi:hypothetical protein